jgi:hypothetical protein
MPKNDVLTRSRALIALLMVAFLAAAALSACGPASEEAESESAPVQLEPIEGKGVNRVTLTSEAAERLGIETAPVTDGWQRHHRLVGDEAGALERKLIPYSAVLYDASGVTWAYVNPEPLTFIRHRISIDFIEGAQAVLTSGPPVGTKVVTVGGSELFGSEFEFEEE